MLTDGLGPTKSRLTAYLAGW